MKNAKLTDEEFLKIQETKVILERMREEGNLRDYGVADCMTLKEITSCFNTLMSDESYVSETGSEEVKDFFLARGFRVELIRPRHWKICAAA